MYTAIIIYLVINSLLFALTSVDSLVDFKEAIRDWFLTMLFGIPILIFNSIPRWNWFLDNVWFWIVLRLSNKYANKSQEEIDILYRHLKDHKQLKAMFKKYNYKPSEP